MESKAKMVNDLLSAMQSEEGAKKEAQKQLMVEQQRVRSLEREISSTRTSLERARGEASKAHTAFESMKRKANSYRQDTQTLLSSYDNWIVGDRKENAIAESQKPSAWATVRNSVLNRSDSSRYSDRISALLEKRNSVRK